MESNTAEYGPKELAEMLSPMILMGERKLTFHDELSERVQKTMGVEAFDADFVIGFLYERDYIWNFDVERKENGAYMLTEKGMNLLRRYL